MDFGRHVAKHVKTCVPAPGIHWLFQSLRPIVSFIARLLIRVIRLRCLALASPWRWIWPCPTGNSLRSIASRRVSSQWMPWRTYGQMLPSSNIGPGSMHLRYWCVRVPMEFQSGLGFELGSAILRVLRDIWEQARGAKCASKPFLGSATRKATALSRSHTSARQYS